MSLGPDLLWQVLMFFVADDALVVDTLSRHLDLLNVCATCHDLLRPTDKMFGCLLTSAPCLTGIPTASTFSFALRPCLAEFVCQPERRRRALTACDQPGKDLMDSAIGSVEFCVRFVGFRRGQEVVYPSEKTILVLPPSWFRMRPYNTFKRLVKTYSEVSHLPLEWISFEISGKAYEKEFPPDLPRGELIKLNHSPWSIGVESMDTDCFVETHLTCDADETFVCVRDKRTIKGTSPRWDHGFGDGSLGGAQGKCARCPRGWLFKIKATDPLETLLNRVRFDVGEIGGIDQKLMFVCCSGEDFWRFDPSQSIAEASSRCVPPRELVPFHVLDLVSIDTI